MIWDHLTSSELGALSRDTPVILPMAATEQHGPHLPLATDRLIAEHFAHQLHLQLPDQVLVLPSAGVGCSDHHMDFPGTLTLSHQVFSRQVEELVKSVVFHGFKNVILFNSHGGNQGIGQVILEKLGNKYPDQQFVMTSWWQLAREELLKITTTGFGGVGHAGEFETSLMMVIAPDLVRTDSIEKGKNKKGYSWSAADMLHGPRATHYRTMKQLTPNGVFGDPEAASSEKGVSITEVVVEKLSRIVKDLVDKL